VVDAVDGCQGGVEPDGDLEDLAHVRFEAAPALPMLPGTPARRTYTYVRNGTSDLYAALDVASGKVLTLMTDQHRAVEFRAFLNLIDKSVPAGSPCTSSATTPPPQGTRDPTLAATTPPLHPPLHPDLQLLAQPSRALVLRADDEELRRPTHHRVDQLRRDINNWVDQWNTNPHPFTWRKTADQILDNLAGCLQRINDSRHWRADPTRQP
jgi:hypothetical protein